MTEATNVARAPSKTSVFRGCLLGGAVGDALGAPIEFMSLDAIRAKFGPAGLSDYAPAYGRLGAITDDTQMTLFTAEGMLRAWVRMSSRGICSWPGVIGNAYERWHYTQEPDRFVDYRPDGWLIGHHELHALRAPGRTCIDALRSYRLGAEATNDSKGCGGVMRVAPIGLFGSHSESLKPTFDLACKAAALTHGHPTGQLASGALAGLVYHLANGSSLPEAIDIVLSLLRAYDDACETIGAIELAVTVASSAHRNIEQLGQGWVAEEALAMGLYAALVAQDVRDGLLLAVNHSGDSDSTGSIAGQLMGAMHGEEAIPAEWLEPLELREVIITLADDLVASWDWDGDPMAPPNAAHEAAMSRYPGY